jgi:hypothetical protein
VKKAVSRLLFLPCPAASVAHILKQARQTVDEFSKLL